MADFIPKAATNYIKNKKLNPAFSYKDVWREEHATSFTVAKVLQRDVLSDMHNAALKAIEKGQSFDSFKKNIIPTLQEKGWMSREVTDPVTGRTVTTHLGSDRRLKTIYNVNMRSAYQKGQYDRTMASDLHPYLMYRVGPSVKHREEHLNWDGLVLDKNDPWWDSHFPPNGWGCKCYTRAVTERQKQKFEAEGLPVPPGIDGNKSGKTKIKTVAPPDEIRYFYNDRKRVMEAVPKGVDPAFNWHQGKAPRGEGAEKTLEESRRRNGIALKDVVPDMADKQRIAELQRVSTPFFKKLKKDAPIEFFNMGFYSKGNGPEINYAINRTEWEKGLFVSVIHSLDKTIAKYPALDADTWFFKGDDASHWIDAIVGKTTSTKGFLSTTAIKSRADSYITENKKEKPYMVVIHAPKKTKGLYIGSNTAYNKEGVFKKNEYEFLFPRDAIFKVLEKDDTHIVLEAIVE